MTNLDSILKSRDITLPTKVHLVKATVFPVVMYGCESWTIKKAVAQLCPTFWDPMDCGTPGFPVHHNSCNLLKLKSIKLVMPSNHHILCCPLFHLPSIFLAAGSFPISQLFTSSGQSIGASASVLPVNIQGWFPLGSTVWISLLSKGLSSTTVQKYQFFSAQPSLWPNSHLYMTTGKTTALTIWTFVGKVMSLLF